jgi:hypothetical protein
MGSEAKHTPGPYFWREFAQDAEDLAEMRKLGMTPTRMLTNEGQIPLMAGEGHDVKRIALIDCQTNYKRGQGCKTACAERDANATLFAAASDLLAAAQKLEAAETFNANCDECEGEGAPELCEKCFPLFDDARIARRLAIAKALASPPTDSGGQS